MNMHRIPQRHRARGFTLVEVMVSITVMGLVMVGISQLMNSALLATRGGYRHMDADTQARNVLDRIAYDIAKITKRSDVDYYFQKNTGSDQMAFFSESSGYYPTGVTGTTPESNVSLVGYRINGNNQLERLSKALIWNGVTAATTGVTSLTSSDKAMVFLPQTIGTTWPNVEGTGTDTNYQVIGDQVFRLEFSFLVQNSSTSAQFSDTPYLSPNTGINGLQDVVAIVVTIAVLDAQSRSTLSATALQTAANNLPDSSTGTTVDKLPSALWKAQLQSTKLGLPSAAASQVRIYQRYCYLNHLQ